MAQLIKLKDYISRYEWNAYRYPSQYIRLKQENWEKLYQLWNSRETMIDNDSENPKDLLPTTEAALKQHFLDNLLSFQLRWATSTVADVSFTDKDYQHDVVLKYFLQRFPDIYFLMYYPIFNIKNASVDGEIILISPFGIEIIYLLEDNEEVTIMAGDDRTWLSSRGNIEKSIISPLISLKRTEHIIRRILNTEQIDFPIQKIVLSRTNNIVFTSEPYQTKIIGKYQYEKWFSEKRRLNSSLKAEQLKVVEALLKYCLTTSIKRPEWEEDDRIFPVDREE